MATASTTEDTKRQTPHILGGVPFPLAGGDPENSSTPFLYILSMEVPPQSSPKRKEPAGEEKLIQLDDLRTLLKEERQSWNEELKHEFQGWSLRVNSSLEKFEDELSQVAGKIQTVQSSVEAIQRDRQAESSRVYELEKRMGAMETRSTTRGSHAEGEGDRR